MKRPKNIKAIINRIKTVIPKAIQLNTLEIVEAFFLPKNCKTNPAIARIKNRKIIMSDIIPSGSSLDTIVKNTLVSAKINDNSAQTLIFLGSSFTCSKTSTTTLQLSHFPSSFNGEPHT